MGYSISPASLRLDDLTPTILRLLRQSGERTITIAPETGSDRLRRVINKTVTNDEILAAAEMIFAAGIENLKLYFMIGLPTETDEDLVAIRDLTLQLREIMLRHARARGHVGRIVGSVNPLVPKPGTAYQWLPMEDDASIERKIQRMRSLMAGIDNVYFNIKSERHSFYQALLSLGDRRVAPAIEAAERNGGNWRAAVAETGVDADFFVFRDRSRDAVLPWDIIDGGMKDELLPRRVRQGAARGVDAAAEAAEGERAPAAGSSRRPLTVNRVTLARVGITVGTVALMVLTVVVITGGFVIDVGPLHFSPIVLLPPLVIAAAAVRVGDARGSPVGRCRGRCACRVHRRHASAIALSSLPRRPALASPSAPTSQPPPTRAGISVRHALIAQGGLVVPVPLASRVDWPDPEWSFRAARIPAWTSRRRRSCRPILLGFRSPWRCALSRWRRERAVPRRAVASLRSTVLWHLLAGARLHSRTAGRDRGARCMATSPLLLSQVVQHMSDIPATALWTLALLRARLLGRPISGGRRVRPRRARAAESPSRRCVQSPSSWRSGPTDAPRIAARRYSALVPFAAAMAPGVAVLAADPVVAVRQIRCASGHGDVLPRCSRPPTCCPNIRDYARRVLDGRDAGIWL